MQRIPLSCLASAIFAAASIGAVSGAQAAAVTCGDLTLGLRTTTVDPALGCLYAGLDNLGDPELVSLVNSLIAPDEADLLDRDTVNHNGGLLDISGVGGSSGTWTLDTSLWDGSDRLFLYFHFGDAKDDPSSTSETDPDIFIVELMSPHIEGDWSFSGGKLTGLSNIGLLGVEGGGGDDDEVIPEPGMLFLMGAGLVGLGLSRRKPA